MSAVREKTSKESWEHCDSFMNLLVGVSSIKKTKVDSQEREEAYPGKSQKHKEDAAYFRMQKTRKLRE